MLSGGVGGARFVRGLVDAVDPACVTVIGNVGDDLEVLGLHVSPARPQPFGSSRRPVSG